MRKDKKQAGRDLTNEKNRRLAPPGGNLFRFGLCFGKKRKNGQAGMRRTEKRGNFRCPMEKCSAGGAEKAPPAPVVPVVPSRRFTVVSSRPSERASGCGCFRNDGAGESGKKNKEKTAAGSQGFRLRFANRKNTLSGKTRRIPAENRAKRGAEDSGGKPGESYPFFLLQIVRMRIPES